jgi:hypothetical protein
MAKRGAWLRRPRPGRCLLAMGIRIALARHCHQRQAAGRRCSRACQGEARHRPLGRPRDAVVCHDPGVTTTWPARRARRPRLAILVSPFTHRSKLYSTPPCSGPPLDHARHVTACTSCGAFLWGDLEMRPPCSRFLQAYPESYALYRDARSDIVGRRCEGPLGSRPFCSSRSIEAACDAGARRVDAGVADQR